MIEYLSLVTVVCLKMENLWSFSRNPWDFSLLFTEIHSRIHKLRKKKLTKRCNQPIIDSIRNGIESSVWRIQCNSIFQTECYNPFLKCIQTLKYSDNLKKVLPSRIWKLFVLEDEKWEDGKTKSCLHSFSNILA